MRELLRRSRQDRASWVVINKQDVDGYSDGKGDTQHCHQLFRTMMRKVASEDLLFHVDWRTFYIRVDDRP